MVKDKQNIIMIGNPGSGKTHLSTGLGLKACQAGMNVKFYTAANFVNELTEALQLGKLGKFEKALAYYFISVLVQMVYFFLDVRNLNTTPLNRCSIHF